MKRLFVAIKIHPSEKYKEVFRLISTSLRHERIKWVEPQNMHLTLKFLGETDDRKIPEINTALQNAVATAAPFELQIANTGIFGSRYDPKLIWFGIDKNLELEKLAKNIFAELQPCGLQPDRQNFVPHLTIGRIKEISDKPLFQQIISKFHSLPIQNEAVSEIMLYESILKREGPTYIAVSRFKL